MTPAVGRRTFLRGTAAAASPDEYVGNAGRYLLRVLTGTYVPAP